MRNKGEKSPYRAATLLEKISFGLGDFSNNGIFTFVSTYLMFYYTDVVGLSLSAISAILLIGRTVDAVCSPIVGAAVDKTSTRLGKCRPFLAAGIIPACVLMALLFSLPDNLGDGHKAVLATLLYVFFSIIFAFMNVPYSTMLTVVSGKNKERISFNMFKNLGANLGGIFVTVLALALVKIFSANGGNGYFATALLFGGVFLLATAMCVIHVKERIAVPKSEQISLKKALYAVLHNKPWMILCAIQFVGMTYMILRSQGTIYYAKYYLQRESISALLLTMMPVAAVLAAFYLPHMTKKRGMKSCVLYGNILWCIAMVGTWFAADNIYLVVLFHAAASIGWAVATGMVFVMLSQTIDYAQWKTGVRSQGVFTSLVAFVQKMGVACAGVVCSQILNLGGYVANQEASDSAIFSIRMVFCGIPFVLSVVVIGLISFYHLDEIYPKVERELKMREQSRSQEVQ